ncbi:MAG TPA: B-box zinc finger protein [Anaerolineales bacterium]|nr:B-box zinc finger protein [Anaerolineales bacterium]
MTEHSLTCANHPQRETTLRCNHCDKPICPKCAVQTPVGYRCRECIRGHQKVYETSTAIDLPVAGVLALISVSLATAILDYLGFWGLFVAPIVGGGVAEIIRFAVKNRRSRQLTISSIVGGVLGVLLYLGFQSIPYFTYLTYGIGIDPSFIGSTLLNFAWPLGYGALIISTMYYRLGAIKL